MKLIFIQLVYFFDLFALAIYSYSQVDIDLDLFAIPLGRGFLNSLIHLGAHERLLSGTIFVTLVSILFLCFFYFWANRAQLSWKNIVFLGLGSFLITLGVYPGFLSHDIFSYMIYAKTLAFYHLSPWGIRPIDFPSDPIVPYVHWQTSFSRYGPVWVTVSALFYFLSGNNFLLAMWLLKLLLMLVFVGCIVILYRLCKILKIDTKAALVFLLFNPFFLIEGLASPHTDMLMGFFALLSLYFLLKKHFWSSTFALLLSIGTKIVTIPLVLGLLIPRIISLRPGTIVKLWLMLNFLGTAIIASRWSLNPWYVTAPLLFSALVLPNRFYRFLAFSLTAAVLVRYVPYFYLGFFDPGNKIRLILFILLMVPFILWVLAEAVGFFSKKKLNTIAVFKFAQKLEIF